MLTEQYRMHSSLCSIISQTFYFNKLVTAPSVAAARRFPIPASFVESGGNEAKEGQSTSFLNVYEAEAAVALARLFVGHAGFAPQQICVITFYNAQRDLLVQKLANAHLGGGRTLCEVEVLSVDSMQGRELDVVILSCVRTSATGLGFLADPRRVNVGLSRAREAMVVLGSIGCLNTDPMWRTGFKRFPHGAHYKSVNAFDAAFHAAVPADWARPLREAMQRAADALAGKPETPEELAVRRKADRARAEAEFRLTGRWTGGPRVSHEERTSNLSEWSADGTPDSPAAGRLEEQLEEDIADNWDESSEDEAGGEEAAETWDDDDAPVELEAASATPGDEGEQAPASTAEEEPPAPPAPPAPAEVEPVAVEAPPSATVAAPAAAAPAVSAAAAPAASAAAAPAAKEAAAVSSPSGEGVKLLGSLLAAAAAAEGGKKARLALTKASLRKGEPRILKLAKGQVAQVALLSSLEACCAKKKPLGEIFEHIAMQLYELDGDVMSEDSIFAWAEQAAQAPENSTTRRFLEQSKGLIEWLQQEDSSDGD